MIDWQEVSPLWVIERSTGLTALFLLSLATFLGAVTSAGWRSDRFPEVRSVSLHRNVSLLSLCFLVVHVGGVVLDKYVDVPFIAVFVPFTSEYEELGVALGTIAFDLVLALILTGYLRAKINRRAWRLVHDLTYVCWAVATVHALLAGFERTLTLFVAVGGIVIVLPTIVLRYAKPYKNPALETRS